MAPDAQEATPETHLPKHLLFLRHLSNAAATTHAQFHPVGKREASLCLLDHRDVYSSSRRGRAGRPGPF